MFDFIAVDLPAAFNVELAVLLFLITLIVECLSWIGNDNLVSGIHRTTSFFSSSPSSKAQRQLRTSILSLRAELASTSSQDEFAKWAKLRRKLDGSIAQLEAMQSKGSEEKAALKKYFGVVMFAVKTVLPFVIQSWHRKEAVFWLPNGWFGPATWWLGLPSAPMGGLACGVWTMACKRTIGVVKDLVVETFLPIPVPVGPVPVPVAVPASGGAQGEKSSLKDEL